MNDINLILYRQAKGNWEKCLDTWLFRFERVSTLHISVHWVAVILLLCFPIYGYFVLGLMVPFFDLVIPFVDDTSVPGYFIQLIFQFVLCIFVISIMYSVDYVFILTLFSGAAIIDLVEVDCKALTFAIENSKSYVAKVGDVKYLLDTAIRRNQLMRRLVSF